MTAKLPQFHDILDNLSAIVYTTNLNSQFDWLNVQAAHLTGYSNRDSAIGCRYHDLRCSAVEFADTFEKQDKQVIDSGVAQKYLALVNYSENKYQMLMGEKSPIYTKDKELIGIYSHFIDIPQQSLINHFFIASNEKLINYSPVTNKQFVYHITKQLQSEKLTPRQIEILYFLLRGLSAREIGICLHISRRTVEDHINNLKALFFVNKKSSLISIALEKGYGNIMPDSLFLNAVYN